MNKSKKELYEENKKLKKALAIYSDFWEIDAIEECTKERKITRRSLYGLSIVLLIAGAFILGLSR